MPYEINGVVRMSAYSVYYVTTDDQRMVVTQLFGSIGAAEGYVMDNVPEDTVKRIVVTNVTTASQSIYEFE